MRDLLFYFTVYHLQWSQGTCAEYDDHVTGYLCGHMVTGYLCGVVVSLTGYLCGLMVTGYLCGHMVTGYLCDHVTTSQGTYAVT